MQYGWVDYYQNRYEEEKKKNTVLAGKVADAEAKREELQEKYASICANPLYRASRIPSFLKRGLGKIKRTGTALWHDREKASGEAEASGYLEDYAERLQRQKDRYEQWIREEEADVWRRYEEAVEGNKKNRICQVIPYQKLAGITDLKSIPEREALPGEKAGEEPGRLEILLFAENPEELDERAVSYVEAWFTAFPDTKFLYGAQDHLAKGKRCFPWFKPCWSPDTLLGFFYIGSYFAVDAAWAEQTVLSGYADAGINLYDYVLRLLKPYFAKPETVLYDKNDIRQTIFCFGGDNRTPRAQHEDKENKESLRESQCYGENRESRQELQCYRENGASQQEPYRDEENGVPGAAPAAEIVCLELVLYHRRSTADFEVPPSRDYYLDIGKMRGEANPEFWGYEKEFVKLKQDFIKGTGYDCFAYQTCFPDVWSVVPAYKKSEENNTCSVSVIILSKDHPELLRNCITSFLERTSLTEAAGGVEFIVVDNGSSEENRLNIQRFLESSKAETHYIYHPMAFNFSALCNIGVREARGEYVLLLNDDVEIIEKNWLRIMLGQAQAPGTGAVGAKLWYPGEEKIQHAGVTNMHIGPSHKLTAFPDDRVYYYGHNTVVYDMLAVTAACLLVKKAIYEEMGGLDESMAVAYNDVDFCFRLARAGYRNVQRNDAVLLHHESASRGIDELSEEKWYRLIREKTNLYEKHPLFHKFDPYYSEQLSGDAADYHIVYQYPFERLMATAVPERKEGKEALQRVLSGALKLTMDAAGKQHKIYFEEPDILEMAGWWYVPEQDNGLFERWLILEAKNGDFYYQVPVKERFRPDVEEILPAQRHVELSGFTCRVLREDVEAERYAVGVLCRNLCTGKLLYSRSEREVVAE